MPSIKTKTRGFAVMQKGEKLVPYDFELPTLGPWDILIEISHCGICHSDIHLIDNDWGISNYPLVPGHEIVGKVIERGEYAKHRIGARVGVGWQCNSCHHCEWCRSGEENLCSSVKATCVNGFGGFAEKIVVDSRFAFLLPDSLESQHVAPLLCGGITVFSPMLTFGLNAIKRVAVVGVGGLGHLAVQFAHAFGAEVYALSTSKNKREEALALGADHFILPDEWKSIEGNCDLLISSVSTGTQLDPLLALLRPKGVVCLVGAPQEQISTQIAALIPKKLSISGSNIGSGMAISQMLQVAAKHGIVAKTELFPFEKVNEAIEKVRHNQVRYRAVLKIA